MAYLSAPIGYSAQLVSRSNVTGAGGVGLGRAICQKMINCALEIRYNAEQIDAVFVMWDSKDRRQSFGWRWDWELTELLAGSVESVGCG